MTGFDIDGTHFKAITNQEGQYSIWPFYKKIPDGWSDAGFSGTKAECSGYVDKNWSDMRPKSLISSSKS
jgi:MbtH protein